MVSFTALLKKFASKGEKSGWTYFEIPKKLANQIKPDTRRSFRVKGRFDEMPVKGIATVPMGEGNFIVAVNAEMRKKLKKIHGAKIKVEIEEDTTVIPVNKELLECMKDEPDALLAFNKLPGSHQKYYSRWIESAKTEATKAKRIAQTINGMLKGKTFGEVVKSDP